jgi:Kef-type K+ transport system membrane component KefB
MLGITAAFTRTPRWGFLLVTVLVYAVAIWLGVWLLEWIFKKITYSLN